MSLFDSALKRGTVKLNKSPVMCYDVRILDMKRYPLRGKVSANLGLQLGRYWNWLGEGGRILTLCSLKNARTTNLTVRPVVRKSLRKISFI